MTFKTDPGRKLSLQGTSALPDRAVLLITLRRHEEALTNDGRILSWARETGMHLAQVRNGKYSAETPFVGPGKYVATVTVPEDLHHRALVDDVKKKVGKTAEKEFEHLVWDDPWVGILGQRLSDVRALIKEVRTITDRLGKATSSESEWKEKKEPLLRECKTCKTFRDVVTSSESAGIYPAVGGMLEHILSRLIRAIPHFIFEIGRFAGARDDDEGWILVNDENDVWSHLDAYLDGLLPVAAGHEFCLLIVQDLRRTGAVLRPEILKALESMKSEKGVEPWVERLKKANPADLDPLEQGIRAVRTSHERSRDKK